MIVQESQTQCFAWALIPNHFHLLLKTGATLIAIVMKRLLTGYAMRYNRRHKRCGHLFQNRYKSILCQEAYERKYRLKAKGIDLDHITSKVAQIIGIDSSLVWSKGRQSKIVQARSLLCYWATKELGVSQSALSRKLELAPSAISLSVVRGRELARKYKYNIET